MFQFLRSFKTRVLFSEMDSIIHTARTKIIQETDLRMLPPHLSPRSDLIRREDLDLSTPSRFIFSIVKSKPRLFLRPLILNFLSAALALMGPIILKQFIQIIQAGLTTPELLGGAIAYGILLGVMGFLSGLCMQHHFHKMLASFQILTNVINKQIYIQSLNLTQGARQRTPVGDIVNHMSSDSDSVADIGMIFGELQTSLITIIGVSLLLFWFLGSTALVSLFALGVLVPLTKRVGRDFSHLEEELMNHRDHRITLMSQALNAIRIVKFFVWEASVKKEVNVAREKELGSRRKLAIAESVATLCYVAVSTLVLFVTLAVHSYRGYALDASTIFACIALFDLLEGPFGNLSSIVARSMNAYVGANRIVQFLKQERVSNETFEFSREHLTPAPAPNVFFDHVTVAFRGAARPALDHISFTLKAGSATAIVGRVGSGKSTLLYSMLDEVPRSSGVILFKDQSGFECLPRFGYVPQEAYIVNGSLEENIIFGNDIRTTDAQLQHAIWLANFETDVTALPTGIKTEIGERGVNLSGGQKQRVSLARAVLQSPSLVLLDDPLSAVDPQTEDILIERLFFGEWQDRTRVIATHRLAHLQRFDQILFLNDGRLIASGTFDELFQSSAEFRHFVSEHGKPSTTPAAQSRAETSTGSDSNANTIVAPTRITEDEDRQEGAVKGSVYWDYILALGGTRSSRRPFILGGLLIGTLMITLLPMAQKSWLAYSAKSHDSTHQLHSILIYGCLGLVTLLAILANRIFWMERGMAAGRDMHEAMLNSVLASPLRFFDATPVGRVLQRFSRDVESVDLQLQWSFEQSFRSAVYVCTTLLLIIIVVPKMLFVIGPILFLYYRVQKSYRIPAREAKRLDSITRSPRYAHFKETLQGLPVIRSYGKGGWFLESFHRNLERSQQMFYNHYMLNRWFSTRVPLLGGAVSATTCIGISLSAYYGSLSAGVAGLVALYAMSLWEYLNWGIRIFADVEARMTSVERLKYYSNLPAEKSVMLPMAPLMENWPASADIVFDRVKVRYATHLPLVLKEVSFNIAAGTRVGIVGRTGAGKSTIFQTLFRSMEVESGEIRIDGINIACIPLNRLRRSIAIIPQDPTLFMGTLRLNLDRYNEYSDGEIIEALKQACMWDFVSNQSLALNMPVVENGQNFSQGQRQLICLARALLVKAKIIVLDEATASIDMQTDAIVQHVIRHSCRGMTIVIIAHRLGTLSDCDQIIEIIEGTARILKKPPTINPTPQFTLGPVRIP